MVHIPEIRYDLPKLQQDLIELIGELGKYPARELGWLEKSFNLVKYSDPAITNEIRENTRHLAAALTVLYMVVVIESYFPPTYVWTDPENGKEKKCNLWEEVRDLGWMKADELTRLRAYRHIRHTYAHSHEGKRAEQCYKDFNTIMKSSNPLPGINPDMWDEDKITVGSGTSVYMTSEITPIIQNILSRMLSTPEYGAK